MGEKISEIRDWARNRARYASSLAAKLAQPGGQIVATKDGKQLDLANALDDLDEIEPTKNKDKSVSVETVPSTSMLDDLD